MAYPMGLKASKERRKESMTAETRSDSLGSKNSIICPQSSD